MPETSAVGSRVFRFGAFEVDVLSAELRKAGVRIALQDQPFRVLVRLVEHSGELVTRDELQRELWPQDTFVDFERGLNTAVKRLRDALGDDADTPRFIETRPRHGYRFVAPVSVVDPANEPMTESHAVGAPALAGGWTQSVWGPVLVSAVTAAVLGAVVTVWLTRKADGGRRAITRLDLSVRPADRLGASAVTAGGARTNIAVTADGRTFVFAATIGTQRQLFVRSLDRESAEPLAGTEGGIEPAPSPDGQWVAFW